MYIHPIIITEKIAFGGNCIGKNAGKTVFIPYAVPGEKLEVEITDTKRDYDTARIVNILEPSPYRIQPVCGYYGLCGGCNMMHIAPSYQKELRKQVLADCFKRCGIVIPEITVISGPDTGYRCRFQLNDGGLTEKNTSKIIPITSCSVANKEINNWFSLVKPSERPSGRIHLFGADCVISAGIKDGSKVAVSLPESDSIQIHTGGGKKAVKNRIAKHFSGTVLSPQDIVTVSLLDKKISFDVRGFFQSNLTVLESAIQALCSGLGGSNVLDMYSGCGTFSVFLADSFNKVTLVEHNRDALVFAEQNMAGKKHTSFGISGEKWVQQFAAEQPDFDAAVIDPPRSGMEDAVSRWLCTSRIPVIRSLSCDPATHARDISRLIAAGYRLESLTLLDFYPNTCHIESLASLVLENNNGKTV
ncbi:MAG: TRAM domain-containing protein [Treponema sp.]|nr:TRAM domain-containing protein [Treponema sp.]